LGESLGQSLDFDRQERHPLTDVVLQLFRNPRAFLFLGFDQTATHPLVRDMYGPEFAFSCACLPIAFGDVFDGATEVKNIATGVARSFSAANHPSSGTI